MKRTDVAVNTLVVTLVVGAVYGLLWLLVRISDILVIMLISAILAAGLAPSVAALQRIPVGRGRRLGKGWAILLVVLGVFAALGLIVTILVTPIVQQAAGFLQSIPGYVRDAEAWVAGMRAQHPWIPDLSRWIARLPAEVENLAQYFTTAAGFFGRFVSGVFTTTMVIVISIYMLIEGPQIKRGFLRLWPPAQRPLVGDVIEEIGRKFSGWLRGTFVLSLFIFVTITTGLLALGIPYPFLLGLVAGLMELVPNIGPFLGAVPAVLVALFQPTWKLIAVVVLFVVVQQVELNYVVPRVMKRAVGLSPILAIFSLLVGGALMGIIGVLLAVPVAAALQVISQEVVRATLPHSESEANLPPLEPVELEVVEPESPAAGRGPKEAAGGP
ncbi:MAG: AI-2E family transporter [Armatimonadota bacterium]|nr:AI-2E family transporter [Armatimonadota bacterium]MDR5696500.1 AI-2E family transporter [Armatimonadota bacterium]